MNKFLATTIKLLEYNSYSGNEVVIKNYLMNKLQSLQFKVNCDSIGNIYAVRGIADSYPLLNAHMDIVSTYSSKMSPKLYVKKKEVEVINSSKKCTDCESYFSCLSSHYSNKKEEIDSKHLSWIESNQDFNDSNFAKSCTQYKIDKLINDSSYYGGYDYEDTYYSSYPRRSYYDTYDYTPRSSTPESRKEIDRELKEKFKILYDEKTQVISSNGLRILGGDDKCGISIALQIAKENIAMPMKILFTVKEELGCVGMHDFETTHKDWLSDLKCSITIDRREGSHLLMWSGSKRNCSNEFASLCVLQGLNAGVIPSIQNGGVADVMVLRDYCEAINISAGYYGAHSLSETIKFSEMVLIKKWVSNILRNI